MDCSSSRRLESGATAGNCRYTNQGFSLLELLLAAALGIVMIAAVVQLFAGSSRGNVVLGGQARLQESARHAFALLSRSARAAGYLGCGGRDRLVNGLRGSWRQVVEFDVSVLVEGFDATGDGWDPELGALPVVGGGTGLAFRGRNRIDPDELHTGSDIVVFRRVEAPGRPLARGVSTAVDSVTLQAADPAVTVDDTFALQADDFVVISDCRQAALFRIGSIAPNGRTATLRRPAQGGPFGNRPGQALSPDEQPYGGELGPNGAAVARVVTEVYFVARGAGTNNRNETIWSLWRKTAADSPVELVQGVTEMQVLFGIDVVAGDNSKAPSRYVPAEQIGGHPVRAVYFQTTVSSVDSVTADNRVLQQTFTWTVALRNT